MPAYRQFETSDDEANYIARCVRAWQQQGQSLNNIAVVYGYHWQAEKIHKALQASGIPCTWLKTQADKKAYDGNDAKVVLLTRQSSKGLEFDTVILAGLGGLKDDEDSLAQEARLIYVGMTRARRQLLVTGSGENWFMDRLESLAESAA